MAINPGFFQQRKPDTLGIEPMVQAALQVNAQNREAQLRARERGEVPVNPFAVAEAQRVNDPVENVEAIPADVRRLLASLKTQKRPAGSATSATALKAQAELQRTAEFNNAIAAGDLELAAAIDPESFIALQKGQLDLQATQQQMQLDAAKAQAELADGGDPDEFEKGMMKRNSERYSEIVSAGADATEEYVKLRRLIPELNNIYTGVGGEAVQSVRKVLTSLVPGWKDPGDAALGSELRQYQVQAATALTAPYKGAISDREIAMFLESVPGLVNTAEGNQRMAQVIQAAAARKMEKPKFIQGWMNKFQGTPYEKRIDLAESAWNTMLLDPEFDIIERGVEGELGVDHSKIGAWKLYLNNIEDPTNIPVPDAVMNNAPASSPKQNLNMMKELQEQRAEIEKALRQRGLLT